MKQLTASPGAAAQGEGIERLPVLDVLSGRSAVVAVELAEAAHRIDHELFTGPAEPETEEERRARLDAARDILADLEQEDPVAAVCAAELLLGSALHGGEW